MILTTEVVYKVRDSFEKEQMASLCKNEGHFANLMLFFCFRVRKGACNKASRDIFLLCEWRIEQWSGSIKQHITGHFCFEITVTAYQQLLQSETSPFYFNTCSFQRISAVFISLASASSKLHCQHPNSLQASSYLPQCCCL